MTAKDLTSANIPTASISDSCKNIYAIINNTELLQIPLIDNGKFYGLVYTKDIYGFKNSLDRVPEMLIDKRSDTAYHWQPAFSLFSVFAKSNNTIIPIIDEKQMYVGCVGTKDIVSYIYSLSGFNADGGLIYITVSQRDYSVTHIANIIEDSGAKILSLLSSTDTDGSIHVLLKTNAPYVERIMASLERYGYRATAYNYNLERIDYSLIANNFGNLINYLNI